MKFDRQWYRDRGLMQDHKDEFKSYVTFQMVAELAAAWQREQDADMVDAVWGKCGLCYEGKPCNGARCPNDLAEAIREQSSTDTLEPRPCCRNFGGPPLNECYPDCKFKQSEKGQ